MSHGPTLEAVTRQTRPLWLIVWVTVLLVVWVYDSHNDTYRAEEVTHEER